jgi:hypothetical protein
MKKLLSLMIGFCLFSVTNASSQDARAQAEIYIDYYQSIQLTPEQEKIKEEALSSMPAPCCSNSTAATCCCPCNLAKSVWGLSAFLIAKRNYNVAQTKKAVTEWLEIANPEGYTGDSCYNGRCNHSFDENGCGGMNEEKIF